MEHILATLEQLGLSRTKANVYCAALQAGSASAEDIAVRAHIPRTTAHDILQQLNERGLVSVERQKRRRTYTATSPNRLRAILEERERALDRILPELHALRRTVGARPRVQFFEGVEGVKTVFEETLATREPFLRGVLSMQDLFRMPGRAFIEDYTERRITRGVALRAIRSSATEVESIWQTSRKDQRTLHLTPQGVTLPMTMYVYDNKVGLIGTEQEPFGMIVESAAFYENMKHFFDTLWQVTRAVKTVD